MNVYTAQLAKPVKTEPGAPMSFSGRESTYLHVVASSFENVVAAVMKKHPDAEIRGISLLNYMGVPIVIGE